MNFNNTGIILYATIGGYKFSADKDIFSLKVEFETVSGFELIEEINLVEEIIVDHEDLERVALNWMFINGKSEQLEIPFACGF